jgi:hypothetical protein
LAGHDDALDLVRAFVDAASWDLCGVWLHAGGDALRSARSAATDGIDRLEEHVGKDAELTALWGAMHLRAAVTSPRLWAEADVRTHLAEAARVAPASGNTWQTQFNAPNVALHALETTVDSASQTTRSASPTESR